MAQNSLTKIAELMCVTFEKGWLYHFIFSKGRDLGNENFLFYWRIAQIWLKIPPNNLFKILLYQP